MIGLYVFINISFQLFKDLSLLVVVTIFSYAHPIIYQSVEIKQYSTELLATLLIFYFWLKDPILNKKHLLLLGAISIWFSYSSIFILFGVLSATFIKFLSTTDFALLKKTLLVAIILLASFLLHYYFFIRRSYSRSIVDFWQYFFLRPNNYYEMLEWFCKMGFYALDDPLGLNLQVFKTSSIWYRFSLPTIIFMVFGIFNLWKSNRVLLAAFALPLVLMVILCGLKMYVPYQRLALFYSPCAFWIIASGIDLLKRKNYKVAIGFMMILTTFSVSNTLQQFFQPHFFGGFRRNEFREVLFAADALQDNELWIDEYYFTLYKYYKSAYFLKLSAKEIIPSQLNYYLPLGTKGIFYRPTIDKYSDPEVIKSLKNEITSIDNKLYKYKLRKKLLCLDVVFVRREE